MRQMAWQIIRGLGDKATFLLQCALVIWFGLAAH